MGQAGHAVLTAARTWELCAPRLSEHDRIRIARSGKSRGFTGRRELPLTRRQPPYVAALYVYRYGATKVLFGDMDPKRAAAAGAADPLAVVEAETADLAALIAACGGDGFTDVSPATGGRHVYIPWATAISFGPMRRVAEALARRYVSFDPAPHQNAVEGLIVPPGSWVRGGGFRQLTDPPTHVEWVLDHPNGPEVWSALLDALRPELEELERIGPRRQETTTSAAAAEAPDATPEEVRAAVAAASWAVADDEDGVPVWRRPGGPVPRLSPLMESIACTGRYERGVGSGRYGSDSEARQAVIAGAVSCGWRLAEVAARLRAGDWPGLGRFYARYKDAAARVKALRADWDKAVAWIAGRETGRDIHTRERTHGGVGEIALEGVPLTLKPPRSSSPLDEASALQQTRRWYSAFRAAETHRWSGPGGITKRRILRAMLKAAQLRRSMVIGFGVREIGLLAGLDHSTVANHLRELRAEPDPFIDHVAEYHQEQPDIYQLIIPAGYAEAAAWRRWQPGRLGGIHPVFRELGGPAAMLYEVLGAEPVRSCDLPGLAGVSETAAKVGVRALAEHGMAERVAGGWVRGPADPGEVAERLGVYERVDQVVKRYRKEREEFRTWLKIVNAGFGPEADDGEDRSFPDEVRAVFGPPEWVVVEPHGPPAGAARR
ncbi:hypothetical protein [Planomonospora sp. ID82291]|uniref:hypothetical protein n=1 Tax=Planomonospora sp. ID82291 TaxID=2738136 RepID=UPI0018C4158F|nr:hypothetical protein [Planomonospora sp. ID82291]MBG0818961.1 hypothetical protein [Planomonospora sp. ID82291]